MAAGSDFGSLYGFIAVVALTLAVPASLFVAWFARRGARPWSWFRLLGTAIVFFALAFALVFGLFLLA